jgi:hypothetical protein
VGVGLLQDRDFLRFKPAPDPANNRLFILKAAYMHRFTPYLEIGAGAGIGTFSSTRRETTTKALVEPLRIDFRPLALRDDATDGITVKDGTTQLDWNKAWRSAFILRFGYVVFPQGFEPGFFSDDFPRTQAESPLHFAIAFDTELLLHMLQLHLSRRTSTPAN